MIRFERRSLTFFILFDFPNYGFGVQFSDEVVKKREFLEREREKKRVWDQWVERDMC